jgi:hypothetical protein
MEPARQKALLGEFLARAVSKYSYIGGNFSLLSPALRSDAHFPDQLQHFERLLGPAPHGAFWTVTREQSEKCLDELIRDSTLIPGSLLLQSFAVTEWTIDGQPTPTKSMLNFYYGNSRGISTFFRFDTMEQFDYVKRVLEELRICKLNEKHLKAAKR